MYKRDSEEIEISKYTQFVLKSDVSGMACLRGTNIKQMLS